MTDAPTEGVVSKYLDTLNMRGLRRWTVYNRRCALTRLARWSGGPILYLTESDLVRWQKQRAAEIQPEPMRTEMSHHRQFYRWATREGYRRDDPTLRIELPRVARRVPRPIGDTRLAAAMAAADPSTAAILALAAFAGLRACEIAGLDWSEVGIVDRHPLLRVVEGKGGHGRVVPVSVALTTALAALPHRRGPVIQRLDGRAGPCAAHRISSRANEYLHQMGVTETLHQCRHRFATSAYQACQDIRAVQDMLGHASPTTTAIYAASASAVARSAVEAAGHLS
ncbi:tyrosine-type recombinase/integrase [uncultured Jatrophihabitans sp.]|uniref:tyrosine-type recombinase/integrase n=1 Tax=uncultured Jatrophihabitans sp. TaxID=1610747 RepID=UPI0035CA39E4